ncbi:hypothetical protein AA0472_1810 [Acetobacter estunensis NRIC 0472]|nr:hypothetical protein AA0472_1810 [Acetobacter estunensis NRIC 0472]
MNTHSSFHILLTLKRRCYRLWLPNADISGTYIASPDISLSHIAPAHTALLNRCRASVPGVAIAAAPIATT